LAETYTAFQRHAGAKNLPKRMAWCLPCGLDGRAVRSSTVVDGDPTCAGCALIAARVLLCAAERLGAPANAMQETEEVA
jgi:hypothetical protein